MQTDQPTTPFGRRSLTLAHVAAQVVAARRPPDKVVQSGRCSVHMPCAATVKRVSAALSVLDALLSFYPRRRCPETT